MLPAHGSHPKRRRRSGPGLEIPPVLYCESQRHGDNRSVLHNLKEFIKNCTAGSRMAYVDGTHSFLNDVSNLLVLGTHDNGYRKSQGRRLYLFDHLVTS